MERFVYNGRKSEGSYGLTDDLTMSYVGNRLIRVVDAADPVVTNGSMDFKDGADTGGEYTYNACGALTSDLNKGISGIDYDINGNMSKVTFSNGNTTEYVYSQSGAKQRVIHGTVTALPFAEPGISTAEAASVSRDTTEYIGDFVFRNGVLDRLLFRGGYMDIVGGVPRYHYFATDHLGSVRTVYGEDGVAEQLLTYDLFGGIIPELSTSMGMQPYGYNGKELDHTHGLDWYDYGARHYDSPIGRWTTMDPLCEKYYNVSPYVYCHNAPINSIDTDGRDDYQINQLGYIKFKKRTNAKSTHRIFCGNFNITIGRNLVEQLVKNQNNRGTFATISNSDDAFQFFKFVADHTMVEWSLVGVKNRSGVSFKLKTNFEEGSVGNDAKNNSFILFHLHNHPWGSNPFGTKASGNYEDYKKLSPGKDVDGFYTKGDIWRLNDMYNDYKKAHPSLELSKYPKVYIYYPGDKKQKSQLFQYDLDRSKFDPYFNPNYKQIKHKVYK